MAIIKSVVYAVQMFEVCAIKEGEATERGDYKTNNKYAHLKTKCIKYLYESNQLHLLYDYLKHENSRVRLSAACVLLPLYEDECKEILQEIVNGNYGFNCLSAKMVLTQWNTGELEFPYKIEQSKKSSPNNEDNPSGKMNNVEKVVNNEEFSPEALRLSRIFECLPTSNNDLLNEEMGFFVMFNPGKQEIVIRINTFVNPYTQDIEMIYQERLKRFKVFDHVATISADQPSKLGYMQIRLTIPEDKATDDVLIRIKDIIYIIYNEWKQNESLVWFKTEYHKGVSYFEGSWWMPCRAIIKNQCGYERYDFSDEMKYDEDMWEIANGEYDKFENSDSFALISSKEFQDMWEATK